jgi:hypothetical protein
MRGRSQRSGCHRHCPGSQSRRPGRGEPGHGARKCAATYASAELTDIARWCEGVFGVNDAVNDNKGAIRLQLIIVACQQKYQYLSVFVGQVCIRSLLHASRTLNEFADCFLFGARVN